MRSDTVPLGFLPKKRELSTKKAAGDGPGQGADDILKAGSIVTIGRSGTWENVERPCSLVRSSRLARNARNDDNNRSRNFFFRVSPKISNLSFRIGFTMTTILW